MLVGAREAQAVTGLSADQIREWTGRRGIVVPDIPAKGRGTQARFSWQTLLVLLVARTLRDEFHVELAAFRTAFEDLQRRLLRQPFHGLHQTSVVFPSCSSVHLERLDATVFSASPNVIMVGLAQHLGLIAMALVPAEQTDQLPLFRAIGLR